MWKFLLFLLIATSAFSQDTLQVDTNQIEVNVKPHSPKKAGIYSAVLPGLGQIYNRKLWYVKAPLIWGGLIGIGASVAYNNHKYQFYRQQYINVKTVDGFQTYQGYTDVQILQLRNNYESFRDQMITYGIALYAMNIVEAIVAAHLKDFDVSDDLSFHCYPTFQTRSQTVGLGMHLNF